MSRGLDWRGPALVILVGGVIFAPLLWGVPYFRDLLRTDLPLRAHIATALTAGRLPQWYPWDGLGLQFIGNAEGLFRPQTILYLLAEPLTALRVELVVDYALGALGFLLLARRLGVKPAAGAVGALGFAFSGYAVSLSSNLPYVAPYHAMPWLLWAAQGALTGRRPWRSVAVASVCWALIILGGDPLLSIVMGAALVVLVAASKAWRAGLRLLVAVPLTALLVAVWVLPAGALFGESTRAGWTADGQVMALHGWRLPEVLLGGGSPDVEAMLPLRTALDGGAERWSASIVLGGALVGFALLGAFSHRAGRLWTGLGLAATWVALGSAGGAYQVAVTLLPLLGKFRYPEKYLGVATLALCLAATWGVEQVLVVPRRRLVAVFALVVGLGAAGLATVGAGPGARWGPEARAELQSQWLGGGAVAVVLFGCALLLARAAWRQPALAWAPAMVVALELGTAGKDLVWVVPPELLRGVPTFCQAAHEAGAGPGRGRVINQVAAFPRSVSPQDGPSWVTATRNLLEPDTVELCGLEGLITPNLSGSPARLWWALDNVNRWRVARLFNATVAVVDDRYTEGREVLSRGGTWALVRTPGSVLPRAFAARPRWLATQADARAAVRDLPEETFWHEVLLEGEGGPTAGPDEAGEGTVSVTSNEDERVDLSVQLPAARAVVLNDLYAPGWAATVDGVPAPIYRANLLVRAVLVPAGAHTVSFQFATPGLREGAALSCVGLLVVLALALWRGRVASAPA